MEILRVENLTKTYGKGLTKVTALDNVSFTVEKGEFIAIVGASGSGKSTLMHLLGGVDKPTSGKVFIDGQDIYAMKDDKLCIFRRRQVGLKLLGLQNRKNHLPNQLSGGEQQRTSIGRALITSPAIILADEPTGNLDSKASEEIVSILKMSNKKYQQTIIMITHNLEIAKEASRIIKLEDGKIVEDTK